MSERYEVEITEPDDTGHVTVVVVDKARGRRLSRTTSHFLAPRMVGVLVEDHRERNCAG